MSTQLERKRNLAKQLQQISLTFLDDAQKALSQRSVAKRGEGVHNSRKKFKQLRGVLRLMRFALGEEIYKRENIALRDAGRPLSEVRDADVMIETLDNLVRHYKGRVIKKSYKKLRSRLLKRRTKIRKRILERDRAMFKVSRFTKTIRNRIKRWPMFPDRFGFVKKGVRKIYSRGQREMDTAFKDPSVENMHEWRKSVKYLRYQLEILEEIRKPTIGEIAKEAHELADILGLDHDLAVLEELLHGELKDARTSAERKLLTNLIRKRRSELQKEAEEIGPHLYAETPKSFSKRIKGYWNNWHT